MEKDEFIKKRFMDLANQAQRKNIVTFSDFLSSHELNILCQIRNELPSRYVLNGGYDLAERQMIAFLPDALFYHWEFPMVTLEGKLSSGKYAEKLTHRDVLGALMHLGIERDSIGDILIQDNKIYVFAKEEIGEYIIQNLFKIKHTTLQLQITSIENLQLSIKFVEFTESVTSLRIDNFVHCFTKLSRSKGVELIQRGSVLINGKECYSNGTYCNTGDIISIRGYGKYVFSEVIGESKKGKLRIKYLQYS